MDDQEHPLQLEYARPPKRMSRAQLTAITAAAGACLAAGALALRPRPVPPVMTLGSPSSIPMTWQPTTAPIEPP